MMYLFIIPHYDISTTYKLISQVNYTVIYHIDN